MQSHPATLLKVVTRTLREECDLPKGASVVLGVSGGVDSMALLHVLARLRDDFGFALTACGVDHGLRAEASAELDVAGQFARSLAVPFVVRRVNVAPGGNLHARARDARYAELESLCVERGAAFIATAHHADDRAETVLLRVLRGSHPTDLAVLPARDGARLRPMIRARRSQVLAHARRHRIAFVEDPSNRDPRFLRTRIRHELLPLLEQLSQGVVGHLNALADEMAAEPLPPVLDDNGQELTLNRSQRDALRRALRHQTGRARVLISGGRVLVVDRDTGHARLVAPGLSESSHGSGAKLRPSGSKRSKTR
jgi:tRNA(Ile)-lysidine synthase